ncbi:MAG: ECF transporter S component [Clostridium sp.]|uniref:ECF transporter S component n=1 Tax=Clostridium sp. TaxID=1506 RepID=UPI0030588887
MKKSTTINMVISALFIAIGILLPQMFHSLGMSGTIFLPMHIPVLLCGLICGWRYGALVGIIIPLFSSVLTGMPPIYPVGVSMAFELAAYGAASGILSKKTNTMVALLVSMALGRIVSGLATLILLSLSGKVFALQAFLTGAFVTALPGIILQIILIPIIMLGLKKSKIIDKVISA